MPWLCRDCLRTGPGEAFEELPGGGHRCPACASPRRTEHPELFELSIAHIDCDAFYASVEKRDRPELAGRPVIVGGGQRGVVTTACYVARIYGVRSAMPMFKARALCPDAEIIKPDMAKYKAAGQEIRRRMERLTPLVQPLSIDEAFLDLTGTEAALGAPPAVSLARFANEIAAELELTVSIGLSYNKFLAKIASDLDKPRGFALLGRTEALDFLKDRPVSIIWGVGRAFAGRLAADGIHRVGDLWELDEAELSRRYGAMGRRLFGFSRGRDERAVEPDQPTKSISGETTFNSDIAELETLEARLRPLCETVARRLEAKGFAGRAVTLKLKTADFKILTRTRHLPHAGWRAEVLFDTARTLLAQEADGRRFRLIGVGMSDLCDRAEAEAGDLLDDGKAEALGRALDELGRSTVVRGHAYGEKR